MSILNRYLARHFLIPFFYALAVCSLLFIIGEFFELMRFFWNAPVPTATVFHFFMLRLPLIIYQVTPIAVLLATYFCFGLLSRTNELVAIRAAGLSNAQLAGPLLVLSLLICIGSVFFAIYTEGPLSGNAAALKNYQLRGQATPPPPARYSDFIINLDETTTLFARTISERGRQLSGVEITSFFPGTVQPKLIVSSNEAVYTDGRGYLLRDCIIRRFAPHGYQTTEQWRLDRNVDPGVLWFLASHPEDAELENSEFTLQQLANVAVMLRHNNRSSHRQEVELHARLAYPFLPFIFALLGMHYFYAFRQAGLAFGFGLALLTSFLFLIVIGVSKALGAQEIIPPWAAGWLPPVMLLLFSSILYSWRTRS